MDRLSNVSYLKFFTKRALQLYQVSIMFFGSRMLTSRLAEVAVGPEPRSGIARERKNCVPVDIWSKFGTLTHNLATIYTVDPLELVVYVVYMLAKVGLRS